jgi:hypothetical protein
MLIVNIFCILDLFVYLSCGSFPMKETRSWSAATMFLPSSQKTLRFHAWSTAMGIGILGFLARVFCMSYPYETWLTFWFNVFGSILVYILVLSPHQNVSCTLFCMVFDTWLWPLIYTKLYGLGMYTWFVAFVLQNTFYIFILILCTYYKYKSLSKFQVADQRKSRAPYILLRRECCLTHKAKLQH